MFDAHCHLDDPRLAGGPDAALERGRAAGVRGFFSAGVSPEGWARQAAIAARHDDVWVSYGLHPWWVGELAASARRGGGASKGDGRGAEGAQGGDERGGDERGGDERGGDERGAPGRVALEAGIAALEDALKEGIGGVRARALGELGLDALPRNRGSIPLQERAFRAQLALARGMDLPIVLHIVRAHGRALEILKGDGIPLAGGMVHSMSGSAEVAAEYLALGLHLSFSGALCRLDARKLRAAAKIPPLARLLIETDAPDQTPLPRAPAPNEPAFLTDPLEALAALRGIPPEALRAATAANARALFRIG